MAATYHHARRLYIGTTAEMAAAAVVLGVDSIGTEYWDTTVDALYIWDGAAWVSGFATLPHDILSASHSGTAPAVVVRGDLMTGQGVAPLWARLAHPGAADRVLQSTGTEITWSAQVLTLTGSLNVGANTIIGGGGALALGGFIFTVPATGTGVIGGGAGAANRVAYWTDANTLASDAGLTYNAGTDTLSLANSLTFTGATGVNDITVPDNLASALYIVDAGGADDYLTVVSTNAQRELVVNQDGADIDFRVEAVGVPGAFAVNGASGALGVHHAPNALVGLWLDVPASGGFQFGCIGRLTADNAGVDATAYYGYLGGVDIEGAGNLTSAFGQSALFGQITHTSASVVTIAQAVTAEIRFSGAGSTGSITTAIDFFVRYPVRAAGATGTIGTFYGLYNHVDLATLGYVTTAYFMYSAGGRSYHGGTLAVGGTNSVGAQLYVDQGSLTAAIPPLHLEQADLSEEMIQFATFIGVGNPIEAVGAKTLTVTHFIRVTLPGAMVRYIPVGTIA